jgi:hypothetical protein
MASTGDEHRSSDAPDALPDPASAPSRQSEASGAAASRAQPSGAEASGVDAALPSVATRVLAFAAIVVAGVCGGFIGWAFVDLQCTGDCGTPTAIGGLVGAASAAVGVAVVVVLTVRAMGEWRTIQARPGGARPDYGDVRELRRRR